MKIFENKSVFKKLIIVLLCILLLSFCMPKAVNANDDGIGGKLLNPIMSLFVSLGDGAMALLQKVVFHVDASLINIDSSASFWSKLIVVVAAIAIAAVAIAAVVLTGGGAVAIAIGVAKVVITVGAVATITFPVTTSIVEGMLPDSFYLPLYTITPQEIFSNKIPLLDVDFFNPQEERELDDGTTMESTAAQLRPTISNWYTILRDISLVALLSILVYTGIRILISSTSNDRAKYKQMLIDWIVAICLLFVMQYIMSFSNLLVGKFIDLVDTTQVTDDEMTETTEPEVFIITEKAKVDKAYETIVGDEGENSPFYSYFTDANGSPAGKNATQLVWPAENFMQQARIKLQLLEDNKETYVAIGWKLIFVMLVVYTFIFVFTYLKRVVYMAFLTLIAPLVALTYPIDKMTDGKAQAFNTWFREYIFNLLIQPMHLILYTILISSAMDFASENILYVIVALGFMVPAEKLLRKFFGFSKAETPGLLGGAAGAAIMMNGVNKLLGKGPKGGKSMGDSKNIKAANTEKQPRFSNNFNAQDAMLGSAETNEQSVDKTNNDNSSKQNNYIEDNSQNNNNRDNSNRNNNKYNNFDEVNESLGIENDYNRYNEPYNNDELNDINDYLGIEDEGRVENYNTNRAHNNFSNGQDNNDSNDNNIHTSHIDGVGVDNNNERTVSPIIARNPAQNHTNDYSNPARINTHRPSATNSSNNNNTTQPSRKNKKGRSIARAVGSAARYYARGTVNNAKESIANKVHNSHPIRTAARIGAGTIGAAALGTAGLVAGIASGDPEKGVQYAAAGAIGGYKMAVRVPDKVGSLAPQGVSEVATRAYYGSNEEYERKLKDDYIKKYKKDENNRLKLEQKYGAKDAKMIMNTVVEDYIEAGVTDIDEIMAGYELEKEGIVKERNTAIATTKYAKRIGSKPKDMKSKDRDEWQKTFAKEFEKNPRMKNSNLDANDEASKVLKRVDAFYKFKN